MTEEYQSSFMRIPFISKLNEKINNITHDLNFLGDQLVSILAQANQNISTSLTEATEDIRGSTKEISASAESMSDSLTETTQDIKETAKHIAESADSIAMAIKDFTGSTTDTISRFERAIESSVTRLVSTIEDFKNEMLQSGVKVNIAKSTLSLVPRASDFTSGLRDMIVPKRKSRDD